MSGPSRRDVERALERLADPAPDPVADLPDGGPRQRKVLVGVDLSAFPGVPDDVVARAEAGDGPAVVAPDPDADAEAVLADADAREVVGWSLPGERPEPTAERAERAPVEQAESGRESAPGGEPTEDAREAADDRSDGEADAEGAEAEGGADDDGDTEGDDGGATGSDRVRSNRGGGRGGATCPADVAPRGWGGRR